MGAIKQKKNEGKGDKNAQKNDDLVFGPRDRDSLKERGSGWSKGRKKVKRYKKKKKTRGREEREKRRRRNYAPGLKPGVSAERPLGGEYPTLCVNLNARTHSLPRVFARP